MTRGRGGRRSRGPTRRRYQQQQESNLRDAVENARRQNQMPPYGHDNRMDHMSGRRDGDDAQSGGRGRTDSDADDDRSGRQPRNPEDVRTGGPQLHRSSSRRSRSPRRADSANPIRYRDRTSPPSYRPRPFGDPYRAADHEFERDTGASPPQRTPEYSQKADRETEGHEVVRRFVEFFASNEMDPAYIDGWIFEGLRKQQPEKLKRVGRALNAVSGHVNGNLYLSNFSREAYKGNAKRLERLTTGAVVMGASLGLCYNKKGMGIENLDRVHSQFGSLCLKERHGLILEVVDNRALVLWGTSFVGREDPKHDHTREEYFRLANRDKTAPPSKARDVPVIRYVGSDFLKKGSFMRHTKPDWVDLEIAPLAYEGSLCNDDFAKVADTMKLPEDHQLRVRGRHELEKQKIAAAESDARRAQRDGQQILPKEPKERALLVEDDEEGDSKGPGAGDGLNVGGSPWLAIAGSHASGS